MSDAGNRVCGGAGVDYDPGLDGGRGPYYYDCADCLANRVCPRCGAAINDQIFENHFVEGLKPLPCCGWNHNKDPEDSTPTHLNQEIDCICYPDPE